jgi:uncharacterized protein YyaL (SSP411 family)
MRTTLALTLLLLAGATRSPAAEPPPSPSGKAVVFQSWSPELFARARAEHRFVLLDLAAVWCHWCHVMEETTYRDPRVVALMDRRFLAVRADQDADPDLSRRYEDWGWPATIVFAPDGSEIVKRRGYIAPAAMASLLQAIVDDPSPGPSVQPEVTWTPSTRTQLDARTKQTLLRHFVDLYDRQYGGWGTIHKFVDAEPLEYALAEPRYQPWAKQTLDAALALVDPVAGGMFQYSDAVDWRSPHYEKIMSVQAQAIELYVAAYQRWHDPKHLQAAREIARYLLDTLSGDEVGGAFYTSQDADVEVDSRIGMPGKLYYALDAAGRQAHAAPRIDRHVYLRENGWAIAALVSLYSATQDARYRDRALAAAEWIERQRRLPSGGYRHGDGDGGGPYLGDTLAMARAQSRLVTIDARGPWHERALASLRFIDVTFRDARGGYASAPVAAGASGVFRRATRLVDENIEVARLAHALGQPDMVAQALHMLTSPTLLQVRPFSPTLLVLDRELTQSR